MVFNIKRGVLLIVFIALAILLITVISTRADENNSSTKVISCSYIERVCKLCPDKISCASKICYSNGSEWKCSASTNNEIDITQIKGEDLETNSLDSKVISCSYIERVCKLCPDKINCASKICYSNGSSEWKCSASANNETDKTDTSGGINETNEVHSCTDSNYCEAKVVGCSWRCVDSRYALPKEDPIVECYRDPNGTPIPDCTIDSVDDETNITSMPETTGDLNLEVTKTKTFFQWLFRQDDDSIIQEIDTTIIDCINERAPDLIKLVGLQGGYYDLNDSYLYNGNYGISYWYINGTKKVPSLTDIQNEINKAFLDNIDYCIIEEDFPDYNVTKGKLEVDSIIKSGKVDINVFYPYQVNYNSEEFESDGRFKVSFPINFKGIYDIAKGITNRHSIDPPNVDIDYLTNLDYDVFLTPYSNGDVSFSIIDRQQNLVLDENPFVFNIGIQS